MASCRQKLVDMLTRTLGLRRELHTHTQATALDSSCHVCVLNDHSLSCEPSGCSGPWLCENRWPDAVRGTVTFQPFPASQWGWCRAPLPPGKHCLKLDSLQDCSFCVCRLCEKCSCASLQPRLHPNRNSFHARAHQRNFQPDMPSLLAHHSRV